MKERTQEEMFPQGCWKDVTLEQCLEEVRREIKVRKRVYPRWVENKKLNVVTADTRIIMMQRIEKELAKLIKTGESHDERSSRNPPGDRQGHAQVHGRSSD